MTNERIARIEYQIQDTTRQIVAATKEISADTSHGRDNYDHLQTLKTNLAVLRVKAHTLMHMLEAICDKLKK